MAAKWDKQLMDLLKRTGEELKRTGDELKTEAQKLLVEVKDPAKQAKVKEGLENLRTWAVATGKQAAERLETAARHVEETIEKTFEGREATTSAESQPPPATPTPSASAQPPEPQPRAAKKTAAKTGTQKSIGRKKTATKAPAKTPAKKAAAKTGSQKSIGRKKPARPTS
ncbi:transcriptional regulator [Archangium violaceum]|uniref:transcriptional regulator n=1 Tax=Archangium violaceum TaxID=83451 RepID=UPI002B2FEC98|nr:transcriptional regulator [Archangium violaceum]